ncbi:hypothetical protein D9757_012847 [Collybiopsis confluens]|uniref:Transmembrane protein n=1 Tax=Collybiopsis confluens TaxID=2823264 RepID=A0A8H5LGV6_9AGAR|nr:hypothetical protein D9757_012847 [Collybiopsis confluens]
MPPRSKAKKNNKPNNVVVAQSGSESEANNHPLEGTALGSEPGNGGGRRRGRPPGQKRTTTPTGAASVDQPAKTLQPKTRAKRLGTGVTTKETLKANQQQEKEDRYQHNLQQQATLEHQADIAKATERLTTVLRLTDISEREEEEHFVPPIGSKKSTALSEGEEFDFGGIDEISSEDSADEETGSKVPEPSPTKKRSKPAKGVTRAAVDQLKKSMAEVNPIPTEEAHPYVPDKSRKNGLVPDWKARIKDSGALVSDASSLNSGGLNDEDIFATRPTEEEFNPVLPLKNNLVQVVAAPAPASKKIRLAFPAVASKNFTQAPAALSADCTGPATPAIVIGDDSEIPAWAAAKWASQVLPSLYHRLVSSDSPFLDFSVDGKLVQNIQTVLDAVYPGHAWTVRLGDPIFRKAHQRVIEYRGKAGKLTLDAVDKFFANMERNTPVDIANYVRWALPNGPALFGKPIPEAHQSPDDPLYLPPEDIFESKFILVSLASFLKPLRQSVFGDRLGHPVGGLALIAAGRGASAPPSFKGISFHYDFRRTNTIPLPPSFLFPHLHPHPRAPGTVLPSTSSAPMFSFAFFPVLAYSALLAVFGFISVRIAKWRQWTLARPTAALALEGEEDDDGVELLPTNTSTLSSHFKNLPIPPPLPSSPVPVHHARTRSFSNDQPGQPPLCPLQSTTKFAQDEYDESLGASYAILNFSTQPLSVSGQLLALP